MIPFNKYFDHTLLKPDATKDQILTLCKQAIEYDFASVCVNSSYTSLCAKALLGTDIKVATVVGFPFGAMSSQSKIFETEQAIKDGAGEIDTVINIGWLKDGEYGKALDEIKSLAKLCKSNNTILKVIIETCLLTEQEKIAACKIVTESGADYIKTSTGFSTGGATLNDIELMKANIGSHLKIKASGGIRTLDDAQAYISAGCSRLGCSASVEILKDYQKIKEKR